MLDANLYLVSLLGQAEIKCREIGAVADA